MPTALMMTWQQYPGPVKTYLEECESQLSQSALLAQQPGASRDCALSAFCDAVKGLHAHTPPSVLANSASAPLARWREDAGARMQNRRIKPGSGARMQDSSILSGSGAMPMRAGGGSWVPPPSASSGSASDALALGGRC